MPNIIQIKPSTSQVDQYDKLQIAVELEAHFSNPYNYEEVHLQAHLTAPDGQLFHADGFYQEAYTLETRVGHLNRQIGQDGFYIRFAPTTVGRWKYQLQLTDKNGTTYSEVLTFDCHPSESRGFVRRSATHYLQDDKGDWYVPIGENMAWQDNNVYKDYYDWLTALHDSGGNFIRLWHAHWGLGIEWKDGWRGFEGLRKYHQRHAAYQDWLFDFCDKRDIRVMLTLQHHGQISSTVNSNWADNPYNQHNGGSCEDVWDFFGDRQAIADTKNRLRYIVARWGYSTAIMTWELFNEVDWMDEYEEKAWMVTRWHSEMAAFLKSIDPHQHLVSTSFAHANNTPDIWDDPNIDLTQTHFYLNNNHLERALCHGVSTYLEDFGKPTMTGEFGLGATANLSRTDPNGIHLHNALWATLFAGAVGTAMSWWWADYIHPNDLYYHFTPIAKLVQHFDFLNQDMRPERVDVLGAVGDLELSPTGDWSSPSDNFIIINEDGTTVPERVDLNLYLFGKRWNTAYRNPPVFQVYYPDAGIFSVQTSALTGDKPNITVYLDGVQLATFDAQPNSKYDVQIPAGRHYIKVDNTGRDWITIASYSFADLGKKIDAYTLRSADQETLVGWLLNSDYNHKFIATNGHPAALIDARLVIEDLPIGHYELEWWDCMTGSSRSKEYLEVQEKLLTTAIPKLDWDIAFRIRPARALSTSTETSLPDVQLYPNPVVVGGAFQLKISPRAKIEDVSLYSMDGKWLAQLTEQYRLPSTLAAGLYWLKIRIAQKTVSLPIVVTTARR